MRKYILMTILFLFCMFPSACGRRENDGTTWQGIAPGMEDLTAITERKEYYDLAVEQDDFDAKLWEKNPQNEQLSMAVLMGGTGYIPLGTQFYQDEPIQLWAMRNLKESKIYLYTKDGSLELLLPDAPFQYIGYSPDYQWYLDQNGDFYCYRTAYPYTVTGKYQAESSIVKIQSSGKVLYENKLDPGVIIEDFCQLENGKIFLQLREEQQNTHLLAELDSASGTLIPESQIEIPFAYGMFLGSAGNTPAVTGNSAQEITSKIMKVNISDGSLSPVLYFAGTSYIWKWDMTLQDFRVLEDGGIELLWTDFIGVNRYVEKLHMEKVQRIPLVVRGSFYDESWLGERTALFNKNNDTYHVILEDCGLGNDVADFARLTSIQIGAGKGPDILCGEDFLGDYIVGMLEKGALEELTPYIEASGIEEEDYFPLVFSSWRQGEQIYGINYKMDIWDTEIAQEVLGNHEAPDDIETLADALLSWEGNGVYSGYDAAMVLDSFLNGTDTLWGMVDWERDSCNFNTSLFRKLLEASKRYGDDGRKDLVSNIYSNRYYNNVINFRGTAEQIDAGKVPCGILFDDGRHAVSSSWSTLAINANSLHKEGAWEFISYLIGEETQNDINYPTPPVQKKAFDIWVQMWVDRIANPPITKAAYYPPLNPDTSKEKQEEYKRAIQEAKPLPIRTNPIRAIILEESEDFFNGSKSTDEVISVINNRVQLYLDENR